MNATPNVPRSRLRHYLLRWTLGTLVTVWLGLVAQAWSTGHHEAREFADGQLIAVANLWTTAAPERTSSLDDRSTPTIDNEYAQDVAVLAWHRGVQVTDTHRLSAGIRADSLPVRGFAMVDVQRGGSTSRWRAFAVDATPDRRVVVLMDMRERHDLGNDMASHLVAPALLVLPLATLLLWWAVRRGLAPLDHLSREVATLDGFAGQRLNPEHRYREFASTVTAINALVDTLQTRARREREFASDVAHELRTPLAALALQADAVQRAPHAPTAEQLQRLSDEAVRAGHILAQLLDLARAQRVDGDHTAPVSTDLVAVAADLVAAHAPEADRSGHELSLRSPPMPVPVPAPRLMVELALRNLIDNAVRHTPPGSHVVVQVWRDAQGAALAVSDDGQRPGGAPAPARQGLGLGLRLVARMADDMGAALVRDAGEAPMTTRFLLRWPPVRAVQHGSATDP